MTRSDLRAATTALLTPALLLSVSACGTPAKTFPSFPPAADARPEVKPKPTGEVLVSEEAARLYESALEAWGDRGWQAVARICRDAVRKGAPYPDGWCDPESAQAEPE